MNGIPASNSKSKRIRSVPLSDSALDVLNQRDTEDKFEYLFISKKAEKPYRRIHKAYHRIGKFA
jgi:integrase